MDQVSHAEQPRLCAACIDSAYTIAAMVPPDHRILKVCPCGGDNSYVVAVGSMHEGRICHWHAEGPMNSQQAAQVAASIVAQFEKAGMAIHSPRTQ